MELELEISISITKYFKFLNSFHNPNPLFTMSFTSRQVALHLREMKSTFDLLIGKTEIEIYSQLLEWEKNYILNDEENYAKIVHKLHPVKYRQFNQLPLRQFFHLSRRADSLNNPRRRETVESSLKCSFCNQKLDLATCHSIHILNKSRNCIACGELISLESIKVARYVTSFNDGLLGKYEPEIVLRSKAQSWKALFTNLKSDIKAAMTNYAARTVSPSIIAEKREKIQSDYKNLVSHVKAYKDVTMTFDFDLIHAICE